LDLNAVSIECINRGLFLYNENCLGILEPNLLPFPAAKIMK
jgi:hypothetical protein